MHDTPTPTLTPGPLFPLSLPISLSATLYPAPPQKRRQPGTFLIILAVLHHFGSIRNFPFFFFLLL